MNTCNRMIRMIFISNCSLIIVIYRFVRTIRRLNLNSMLSYIMLNSSKHWEPFMESNWVISYDIWVSLRIKSKWKVEGLMQSLESLKINISFINSWRRRNLKCFRVLLIVISNICLIKRKGRKKHFWLKYWQCSKSKSMTRNTITY